MGCTICEKEILVLLNTKCLFYRESGYTSKGMYWYCFMVNYDNRTFRLMVNLVDIQTSFQSNGKKTKSNLFQKEDTKV